MPNQVQIWYGSSVGRNTYFDAKFGSLCPLVWSWGGGVDSLTLYTKAVAKRDNCWRCCHCKLNASMSPLGLISFPSEENPEHYLYLSHWDELPPLSANEVCFEVKSIWNAMNTVKCGFR